MDEAARAAAVTALNDLAMSSDYRDRTDAARCLAQFADTDDARTMLSTLFLDTEDTFVSHAAAYAVLKRQDQVAFTLVAAALADADEGSARWIAQAVDDVFQIYAHERDEAVLACKALAQDPDSRVRAGAEELIDLLTELNPILRPVVGRDLEDPN